MLPLFSNFDYNCMVISSSVDNQSVIPSLTSLRFKFRVMVCGERSTNNTHKNAKGNAFLQCHIMCTLMF